ncbi:site-specific integrase [Deinococcus sp. KSM4-11]|uniref:tyrosine-type recombinase/integrase n=1 Tax=Deinococcus sp. KSM4-11 TaxID=2568654 RepID=UPI001F0FC4B7|nr:site-specific integrase [Deinococcus sp. KSM4-11]
MSGIAATKTEAEDALSRVRTDAARGQFTVNAQTTLKDYLNEWHAARKGNLAAKYAAAQDSLIQRHIIPGLGKRRLGTITPRDLEALYAGLTFQDTRTEDKTKGKPLGDSMKRQVHNLLHRAFADAVRHGELLRNPADVARPAYTRTAAQEEKVIAWSAKEAGAFYQVARPDRVGSVFCFMLATGLRVGEALGLRWENVNAKTGVVHVREALVSLGGVAHRTTPKTARSRRSITVSGDALIILQEWQERPVLDVEAQGRRYVASDAVFTNTIGGPILPDTVYKQMRVLCNQAKVRYLGTHVLRHTFISLQAASGRPVEVVSAHVGHAKASFTLDRYRTVFQHERADMTLDVAALISPSEKGK